jgi:UDP-galactopyranose mutase
VAAVDPDARVVLTRSGDRIRYDRLVSTMPLTTLVGALTACPPEVRRAARTLRHNRVLAVGVGAVGPVDPGWHWLYFPDRGYPFYRVTNMGLCSPRNLPDPHQAHVAYLAEIALPAGAETPATPQVLGDTIAGLRRAGLLATEARIVSTTIREIPMAYPIPTLGRTDAVATVLGFLDERDIYSRGRFGVWMYEYGNMDHAVKMGVDIGRRLLYGTPEVVRLPHLPVEVAAP